MINALPARKVPRENIAGIDKLDEPGYLSSRALIGIYLRNISNRSEQQICSEEFHIRLSEMRKTNKWEFQDLTCTTIRGSSTRSAIPTPITTQQIPIIMLFTKIAMKPIITRAVRRMNNNIWIIEKY